MAGFLAVDSETGNTPGQVREGYGKLRLLAAPPAPRASPCRSGSC